MKIFFTLFLMMIACSNVCGFHIDNLTYNSGSLVDKNWILQNRLDGAGRLFKQAANPFTSECVVTNPYYLMLAAQDALRFINSRKSSDESIVPTHFKQSLPRKSVESTLKFIITTIKQDIQHGKFRILDPDFLNKNFKFIKWVGDAKSASNNGIKLNLEDGIRLTSYAIFNVNGSLTKTNRCACALYEALDSKICKLYSKQQILKGILESPENKKRVRPLVWLSRDDFEDALMQGTVIVKMPNSKQQIFVAHLNNGIEYDKKETQPKEQKRFWYYRELKNSKWSLEQFKRRVAMRQNVVFAGDIYNLGLGKIIAIKHKNPVTKKLEVRLGVVADTGGAFVKNLYQLDLFAGIFNNRNELGAYIKHLPGQTDAYILHR